MKPHTETSSAVIIYAVIAILAIILLIVDIFCFFVSKTGKAVEISNVKNVFPECFENEILYLQE